MTIGQSSNSYSFVNQFSNFEMLVDAFERCGKSPTEITQQMMLSARRSLNLLMQHMANQGPLLFAVNLYSTLLQPGVTTIPLPSTVSSVLDVYIRQWTNLTTINQAPAFTTTLNSQTVNVYQPNHELVVGNYVGIITPIAVGGIVLQGYYPVASVVDVNDFTIVAATAATSATTGGVTPQFTTTSGSPNITVTLPSHGELPGNLFNVPILTTVGGVNLSGNYQVVSITNANQFVINSNQTANANTSVYMNNGQVQLSEQNSLSQATDRILTPMSRSDWAAQTYKSQQGFPYSYWLDRLVQPTMTFWLTPDQNGPYVLNAYYLGQLQDANPQMGEIPNLQYRALEMMTAKLAVKLSVKFAVDKYEMLKAEEVETFAQFSEEDREKAPLFIRPDVGRYYD